MRSPDFGIVAGLAILVLLCASLPYMSIRAGVIVAVTFEQVNAAPYAKTAAKRDDQSLKNLDCTVEKIHKIVLPGAKRGFPQTTLLCPQRSFQK